MRACVGMLCLVASMLARFAARVLSLTRSNSLNLIDSNPRHRGSLFDFDLVAFVIIAAFAAFAAVTAVVVVY